MDDAARALHTNMLLAGMLGDVGGGDGSGGGGDYGIIGGFLPANCTITACSIASMGWQSNKPIIQTRGGNILSPKGGFLAFVFKFLKSLGLTPDEIFKFLKEAGDKSMQELSQGADASIANLRPSETPSSGLAKHDAGAPGIEI